MAQKNTPLINELLERVGQHPDFLTWRQNGKLPPGLIKQLYESLKTDPHYAGQPSRFYMSAIALVNYIYKSWFALMKRLQYQLEGKTRWLEMLKSDAELVETSGVTLETLCHQATEILTQLTPQPDSPKPKNTGKKSKKPKASESDRIYHRPRNRSPSQILARPPFETIQRRTLPRHLRNQRRPNLV